MQLNTTTPKTTKKIQKIISNQYNEMEQELELGTADYYSDLCKDIWKSALEFRDWSALHTLSLCSLIVIQAVAKLPILVLILFAACHGPIFDP